MSRSRRIVEKLLLSLYGVVGAALVIFWIGSSFHAASTEFQISGDCALQFTSWRGRLAVATVDLAALRGFGGERYPLTAAESFADRGDPFGRSAAYGERYHFADRGMTGRFWLVPYWIFTVPLLLPAAIAGILVLARRQRPACVPSNKSPKPQ